MNKKRRPLWRITRGILSIFLPVQETEWFIRSSHHVTSRNIERMRNSIREVDSKDTADIDIDIDTLLSPDWAAAVAASGLSPAMLEKNYCKQRRIWRWIFWAIVMLAPLSFMMSLYTKGTITLQQIVTCLVILSGAGLAWSKALIVTYRLWQLRSHRVSLNERGTFRDFVAENDVVRGAILDE